MQKFINVQMLNVQDLVVIEHLDLMNLIHLIVQEMDVTVKWNS